MAQKSFALIGPGRTGTAFAYLLQEQGYDLRAVIGRSAGALDRARLYFKSTEVTFAANIAALPTNLDFLLIAVRDGEIAGVISNLWEQGQLQPTQTLIHLSGVQPSDIGHIPEIQNPRLALHPLQAVADVEAGIAKLPTSVWSIEGDELGMALGVELLQTLNARWLKLTKEQKPLYHAAACVASNYFVTLVQTGVEMLRHVGFPPDLAQQALLPLVEGTLENLKEKTPASALTGPIARGDAATVAKHLQSITNVNPDWLSLYRILGLKTLEYAPLTSETAIAVKKELIKEEIT